MSPDDLKQLWQDRHQKIANDHLESSADIVARSIEIEKSLVRYDRVNLFAAALLAIFLLGCMLPIAGLSVVMKLGLAISLLAGTVEALSRHFNRTSTSMTNPDLTLKNFCCAELERVDRRIELIQKSLWRFTFPMILGGFVFFVGIFLEFNQLQSCL